MHCISAYHLILIGLVRGALLVSVTEISSISAYNKQRSIAWQSILLGSRSRRIGPSLRINLFKSSWLRWCFACFPSLLDLPKIKSKNAAVESNTKLKHLMIRMETKHCYDYEILNINRFVQPQYFQVNLMSYVLPDLLSFVCYFVVVYLNGIRSL